MYTYTYLIGIDLLMYAPIFLALFFWRKDLRKEMLIAGLTFGIVALLSEYMFLKDYWHPEYIFPFHIGPHQIGSLEDFLYGFLKGGIAAVIYEEVFSKRLCLIKDKAHHWKKMIFPIYVFGIAVFLIPILMLGWNSIYTSALAAIVFLAYLVFFRRDLLPEAITSGFLMVAVTLVGYVIVLTLYPGLIDAWWKLENTSGILFIGIPIEEFLEAFVVGFFGGPFYEFFNGLKLKKIKSE